ncbi:MAG: hypothetical protein LBO70_05265 [Clostridiales Family XIII bacterium]|jgi:uncharacterized BrkB/YihY/UPF0761 family membrane protein|nr:hypothetical protein [Clostridiales Family XIII bacterium]
MEKQIKEFMKYLEDEIEQIEAMGRGPKRAGRARSLEKMFRHKLSDYKHERLVHLIVMLFFVAVTGCVFTATMLIPQFSTAWNIDIGTMHLIGLYIFTIALIVIDIFYIKHYYFLENSVQKLYTAETRIREHI